MGMVRSRFADEERGSPHARGDGPPWSDCSTACAFSPRAWGWSDGHSVAIGTFSPRAWGWSALDAVVAVGRVLPTRVGMVRAIVMLFGRDAVLPTRVGMVRARFVSAAAGQVLPTRVGMVRLLVASSARSAFSPRAWGWSDCPVQSGSRGFSPRAWGWSGPTPCPRRVSQFSPHAWGWSVADDLFRSTRRSPHARGDGPDDFALRWPKAFSPRVWGWSVISGDVKQASVLPTRVGMVRVMAAGSLEPGSPHARGDGP